MLSNTLYILNLCLKGFDGVHQLIAHCVRSLVSSVGNIYAKSWYMGDLFLKLFFIASLH